MSVTSLLQRTAQTLAMFGAVVVAGCGLLDVTDPTALEESDFESREGATLLYRQTLASFYSSFSSLARDAAFLTDEYFHNPSIAEIQSGSVSGSYALDRREGEMISARGVYMGINRARIDATYAISRLQPYDQHSLDRTRIARMFLVRGFAIVALADDFCPGLPLNEIVDGRVVYHPPVSTDRLFERALADLDSALAYTVVDDSVMAAVQVVRARALLGLGRFADAAEGLAGVPSDHAWVGEYQNPGHMNWFGLPSDGQSVADGEGGNGLDYVSAGDPRVAVEPRGTARDDVTELFAISKYPDAEAPMVLSSGVEARLIEAEAALDAGDPNWLRILNDLRATQINPPLDQLVDPGNAHERIDLLFRERAFWLFATGRRLGDLRRLMRHYGRDSEDIFPSGGHVYGGTYGTATSIPFPPEEAEFNSAVTGCTGD